VDGVRVLAFPERIDRYDRHAIDSLYSTLVWPARLPLIAIARFKPGPALYGWDILGADEGEIGEDPWEQFAVSPNVAPMVAQHSYAHSAHSGSVTEHSNWESAYDLADRALLKQSLPGRIRTYLKSLRRRTATRKRYSSEPI
jgi:hypothetical protein